jgi:ATP-dependent Clp protease ATP-binding subunit ClpA
MPKINVYLPDDLADAVKDAGIPVSAVCQRALEQAVRRVTAVREITANWAGAPAFSFTARAMTILETAQADASADGLAALDSGHFLRALVSDSESIAVRVLGALDIPVRQVRAELDRRLASGDGAERTDDVGAPLSAELALAVEYAANESSALGNGYVGTEHLLLGLIGEPDGAAGHVLRFLGADLRVTRRAVAAALAGWDAGSARAAQQQDEASHQAEHVAAAVRAELAPLLARIERLEDPAAH